MGRDTRTALALNNARETLAAWALRAAAANKRMAALEHELALAREQLVCRQNEILSLEKSLGISLHENRVLADRLSQGGAAADETTSELEEARAALKGAEAERQLAEEQFLEQIAALNVQLEAARDRAATAEQHVYEMQQKLAERRVEDGRAGGRSSVSRPRSRKKSDKLQGLARLPRTEVPRIFPTDRPALEAPVKGSKL